MSVNVNVNVKSARPRASLTTPRQVTMRGVMTSWWKSLQERDRPREACRQAMLPGACRQAMLRAMLEMALRSPLKRPMRREREFCVADTMRKELAGFLGVIRQSPGSMGAEHDRISNYMHVRTAGERRICLLNSRAGGRQRAIFLLGNEGVGGRA